MVRAMPVRHRGLPLAIAAIGLAGTPVRADALRPEAIAQGSIFALRLDARLDLALPPEVWDPHLVVMHPGYGTTIARFEEVPP
jgi:hypothetical protein